MKLALPRLPQFELPTELRVPQGTLPFDPLLLISTLALMLTGLVMISSASMDVAAENFGGAFFFIFRHGFFVMLAIAVAMFVVRIPIHIWERFSVWLLVIGFLLLVVVLIPGIGREVNGSRRWIGLGGFNLQASEVAKVCMVMFISGYLVRRLHEVRSTWSGVVKPAIPLAFYLFVLYLEPDYGSIVVITATVMGMIFLGGMRLLQLVTVVSIVTTLVGALAVTQEYRLKRLQNFLDPWADPYGAGYQLSQAQIAFGRGEWFGAGLGNSIQKLFYLPEAHTDFVYSVLAEELGLFGAMIVVLLYVILIARMFLIGRQAEKQQRFFMGYLSYGFAFILAGQAMINIGVNVGALPTKGLTLPLMSYGGSSLVICAAMIAIVQRVDLELKRERLGVKPKVTRWSRFWARWSGGAANV
jgi:cell division protein FtsW